MITEEDIIFKVWHENSVFLDVEAKLEYWKTIRIDRNAAYNCKEDLIEVAKDRLKREMMEKIYGEVRSAARKAYYELKDVMIKIPFFGEDPLQILHKVLEPLINAGKPNNLNINDLESPHLSPSSQS